MSEEDKGGLRRDVEEFDRKKEERGGKMMQTEGLAVSWEARP